MKPLKFEGRAHRNRRRLKHAIRVRDAMNPSLFSANGVYGIRREEVRAIRAGHTNHDPPARRSVFPGGGVRLTVPVGLTGLPRQLRRQQTSGKPGNPDDCGLVDTPWSRCLRCANYESETRLRRAPRLWNRRPIGRLEGRARQWRVCVAIRFASLPMSDSGKGGTTCI